MAGPLAGIRVLDLTMNILGPLAAQILGDMGADVWKVEPPDGDTLRGIGKGRNPRMGPLFMHLNRNKRSIALDLKSAAAKDVLARLVGRADVLLHNMRPQALDRLGLSYADAARINPRIVHCGAFGFGQGGPYAARPAYDDLIQGAVGLPILQAEPGREPRYVASAVVDRAIGMALASAVGMALFARERTGRGQAVEVPMYESMVQLVWSDHLFGETFVPPTGSAGYPRMLDPERRPYRTVDGYISVLIYTDRHWARFFEAIGEPEMARDPRYSTITGRTEHIGWLYAFLARTFVSRTTDEWMELLTQTDIPAAPLLTAASLLTDEHLQATGFLRQVEHPTEGTIRSFGIPSSWSDTAPEIVRQAPRVGEHTVEVLRELDYSAAEVDGLLSSRAAVAAE